MTDRTPTEATLEMRLAGLKVLHALGYTAITASDMWPVYRAMTAASPPAPAAEPVAFTYRNWRGEVSERHVRIIGIRFGSSEWHPEPQLLLRAFDLDKGEEREFAVNDIGPHPLDAAAIRAEADESADRQWCEGAKTAVSMLDPLVIGVDMWPQSAQAKYRKALEEIDRLIATRQSAIIESRRERRALADKGEAE